MHLADFWNESLSLIKQTTDEAEFEFYFSNIHMVSEAGSSLVIEVPSVFFRDQLKAKFGTTIEAILKELTGQAVSISFVVKASQPKQEKPIIKKTEAPTSQPAEKSREKLPKNNFSLNPDFSFQNFVVGGTNDFAYSCALAISKNPGGKFNPLMMYGGVGLGKTHLMQAIGNAIHENDPKANIIYISAENFLNEFVDSIQNKVTNQFKNKYRNADVLLVDDIHDFKNKKGAQEELFNTFNALFQSKKQMVFTCDRPPQELKDFADRLLSRLTLGVNADLQVPNLETRLAILKKKAEVKSLVATDAVFEIIARNITTNVRDLEAALNNIAAYAEITNRELTIETAQNILKDIFAGPVQQTIQINLIQKVVAEFYKLNVLDLKAKKRTQAIAFPRQVAMYLIREMTEFSTTEVGIEFGRDHTTVMHAVQKISDKLKTEPSFEGVIQNLQRVIRERANTSDR